MELTSWVMCQFDFAMWFDCYIVAQNHAGKVPSLRCKMQNDAWQKNKQQKRQQSCVSSLVFFGFAHFFLVDVDRVYKNVHIYPERVNVAVV